MLTKEELAAKLNGREYMKEITREEEAKAKASNLVVAFGYSDDNLELRGAVYDEVSAYEGTTVFVDIEYKSIFPDKENEMFCKRCFDRADKIRVNAKWAPKEPEASWLITTDAPFAPFDIMEDGELFCRGAVFSLDKE